MMSAAPTIILILSLGFLYATEVTMRKVDWENVNMFPLETVGESVYFERIEKVDGYYLPVQDSTYFIYTKKEIREIKRENRKIQKHIEENLDY